MRHEMLVATMKRLLLRAEIIGPAYSTQFLRNVDEAIEREYAAAEVRRKADNEAHMKALRAAA